MSRVLAIGFGPAPGAGPSSAHAALDLLRAEEWRPVDAALDIMVLPWMWWPPQDLYSEALARDAVLLFAASDAPDRARVQGRAFNRADPAFRDVAGYGWAGAVITPGGAEMRDGTLSPQGLARSMGFAGLECGVAPKAGRRGDFDVPNRALFAIFDAQPNAALIELPASIESARSLGRSARYNRYEIVRGVQAAIGFAAAASVMTKAEL